MIYQSVFLTHKDKKKIASSQTFNDLCFTTLFSSPEAVNKIDLRR